MVEGFSCSFCTVVFLGCVHCLFSYSYNNFFLFSSQLLILLVVNVYFIFNYFIVNFVYPQNMTSLFVEPLPKRKRRKGPDEEITKNVVVLRSNQVCEMGGVVLMPKTTLDMSGIKKLGQSKKVTFTKSTSSRDMQRKLEEKFPFLEEASERYF